MIYWIVRSPKLVYSFKISKIKRRCLVDMRSLEEVVRSRQQNRIKYERSNGKGTFVRNDIAHLVGEIVSASGVFISRRGDMFTLKDVNVAGIPVHHINIILEGNTKLRRTMLENYKTRVSFSAKVQKYYSKGRVTYGLVKISNLMPTSVYKRRNVVVNIKGNSQEYYRIDFGSTASPAKLNNKEGFSVIEVPEALKIRDRSLLNIALSFYIRNKYNLYTNIEEDLKQDFSYLNPLEFSTVILGIAKRVSKPTYYDLYLEVNKVKENQELIDCYEQCINQTNKFLSTWNNGHFTPLPLTEELKGCYGIPTSFKAQDGSVLFIVPQAYHEKFKAWKSGSILKLISMYNLPKGTYVTFYNPITNKILYVRTK